jgi:hypothetical protein
MKAVMSSSAPPTPEARSARMMAWGVGLAWVDDFLTDGSGGIESPHDVQAKQQRDEQCAKVAEVAAGAGAVGLHHRAGAALGMEQEQHDQQRRRDQLDADIDVVDDLDHLGAEQGGRWGS